MSNLSIKKFNSNLFLSKPKHHIWYKVVAHQGRTGFESDPPDKTMIGKCAKIIHLKKRKDLNGDIGIIKGFIQEDARYMLEIIQNGCKITIKIKADNLMLNLPISEYLNKSLTIATTEFDRKCINKQFSSGSAHNAQGAITDPHFSSTTTPSKDFKKAILNNFKYRSKQGCSSAEALNSLLNSGSCANFACQSRQKVVMYRTIQLLLQALHGNVQGARYFDQLFPRLTLCEIKLNVGEPVTLDLVTEKYLLPRFSWDELCSAPVNPLLFFYVSNDSFDITTMKAADGDLVTIYNNNHYPKFHHFGLFRYDSFVAVLPSKLSHQDPTRYLTRCVMSQNDHLPTCSASEAQDILLKEFNKGITGDDKIKRTDLPKKYSHYVLRRDIIERLLSDPEGVIQQLTSWKKDMHELQQLLITQRDSNTKITLYDDFQNYALQLKGSNTHECNAAFETLIQRLFSETVSYSIQGDTFKCDYFSGLAKQLLATNKGHHTELIKKLNDASTILFDIFNPKNLDHLFKLLICTQQEDTHDNLIQMERCRGNFTHLTDHYLIEKIDSPCMSFPVGGDILELYSMVIQIIYEDLTGFKLSKLA